jgi:hypothetical protein
MAPTLPRQLEHAPAGIELVINLKTAKVLDPLPPLGRADKVIE